MLGIILGILKVIGIILLILLGIVLALLMIVLFVPIRYKGRLSYHDGLTGGVVVSFLLHIVHFNITLKGLKIDKTVRIFGFRKKKGSDDALKDEELPQENKEASADAASDTAEIGTADSDMPEIDTSESATAESDTSEIATAESGTNIAPKEVSSEKPQAGEDDSPEKPQAGEDDSPEKPQAGEEDSPSSDEEKKVPFAEKAGALYNKYVNDRTIGLLGRVKKQVIRLLKHILPRRMTGHIDFGFDDPSATGLVLAALGIFYGRCRGLMVNPDFENRLLDIDVRIKGHIRIFNVVLAVLLLILNKDFKYVKHNILSK